MTATNGLGESIPPKNLYAKLAEVMAEIGYVEKRGYNDFHRYKFVTEADLVDAVRAKLAARNVVMLPSLTGIDERPIKTSKGKDSTITTARVAFTFCDGDSGETHTAEWAGCGDDPADKGLYKAMTGAAKYFLMKAFLIPTGDDPEADAGTDERSAGGQSTRPRQAPVSDVPSDIPVFIGDDEAGKIIARSDDAGIDRDLLRKAAHHKGGRPTSGPLATEGAFGDDGLALGALASFDDLRAADLVKWIEDKRAKMAEEAKGATA